MASRRENDIFTTLILNQEEDSNNVMMKTTHESRRPVLVPERKMQTGFLQVKVKFLDVFSTINKNLFKSQFSFLERRKY